MSVRKFLEISAVDRHDLEVTALRASGGWIEIRVRSAVDVPVPLVLDAKETLLLVIVPEQHEREPMNDAEKRAWLARHAVARRYGVE